MRTGAVLPLAPPPAGGRRDREGGAALDAALLTAHARGDDSALARLYAEAADAAEAAGQVDAACFFLTHAYVFALSAGSETGALHARLLAYGREE